MTSDKSLARRRQVLRITSIVICALPILAIVLLFIGMVMPSDDPESDYCYNAADYVFLILLFSAPLAFSILCGWLLRENYRRFSARSLKNTLILVSFFIYCYMAGSVFIYDPPLKIPQENWTLSESIYMLRRTDHPLQYIIVFAMLGIVAAVYYIVSHALCRWSGLVPVNVNEQTQRINRGKVQGLSIFACGVFAAFCLLFTLLSEPLKWNDSDKLYTTGWFLLPLVFCMVFAVKCIQNLRNFSDESLRGSLQLSFFLGYGALSYFIKQALPAFKDDLLVSTVLIGAVWISYRLVLRMLRDYTGLVPCSSPCQHPNIGSIKTDAADNTKESESEINE